MIERNFTFNEMIPWYVTYSNRYLSNLCCQQQTDYNFKASPN